MGQYLDWKTVAVGAGTVIVFLGGLLVGFWNSDDAERRRQTSSAIAEIHSIHQRVTILEERVKWLTEATLDQEQRIRTNERILSKLK